MPLTAIAVVLAFRQWYFRRFGGLMARSFGVVALLAVLLISELLMTVVWAVVSDEAITIQLWAEGEPRATVDVGPESQDQPEP
jgi:hypothetical protein